jgi:hypothetical protein
MREDFMEEDDAESGAHTQEQFPLSESELRFIQNISHLIRSQLPRITPQNLRGAAILLLALERLPVITVGVVVEATFRQFDVTLGNFGWADLRLSDEELTLGIGEHFYDPGVGGDTDTRKLFSARAGNRSSQGDIEEWLEYAAARADDGYLTVADGDSDHESIAWETG